MIPSDKDTFIYNRQAEIASFTRVLKQINTSNIQTFFLIRK